jgi:hypothetical protein
MENEKLVSELESSKSACKTSEAIKTLVEFIEKPESLDPFDPDQNQNVDNPYLKKVKTGCF